MTFLQILILALFAWIFGQIRSTELRKSFLLLVSLFAFYWLQPALPIRNLDFWLPTFTILLIVFTWILLQPNQILSLPSFQHLALILAPVFLITLFRFTPFCCLTPTRPPHPQQLFIPLLTTFLGSLAIIRLIRQKKMLTVILLALVIVLFIILKTPSLALSASTWLHLLTNQNPQYSAATDLQWIGFSYLAFRLLHILLDFRAGRLSIPPLQDFSLYLIFFPSLPAGPIDRFPHFHQQTSLQPDQIQRWESAKRLFLGLFRKFVLADSLALLALSPQNALEIKHPLYLWLALFAYSLRLYFDFSGYTDIAIGIAGFAGIRLPENFNSPYLQNSLIKFWNSWHITLADWFRSYVYNPLVRRLRSNNRLPAWLIILIGQWLVMLLIGLWHGFTLNFACWGAWHALGLFINNRWSEASKRLGRPLLPSPLAELSSWALTFTFVSLGWVWFSLPDIPSALTVFQRLFGS